jgi:hypothetical protein
VRLSDGLLRIVSATADPRPLAIVRIVVGIAAIIRAAEGTRILRLILAGGVYRTPYVEWLPVPGPEWVTPLGVVWAAAAICFTVGLATTASGVLLVAIVGYVLALDQQTYSNHLYLLLTLVALLTLADSGAALSLDARRRGTRRLVAAWPATLLKVQASAVYGFAAISKLNLVYLSGAVLAHDLRFGLLAVPLEWRTFAPMSLLSVAAILLELFVAVGLWSDRLRRGAMAAGLGFHLTAIAMVIEPVQLIVFTLEMVPLYLLFRRSTWPDAEPETLSATA